MADENGLETRNWVTPERVCAAQAHTGYRLGTNDWMVQTVYGDEPEYQCCPLALLVISERGVEPELLLRRINKGVGVALVAAELGLPEPYVRGVGWGVDNHRHGSDNGSHERISVRSMAELRYGFDNRHALALLLVGYRHGQRLRRELRLDVAE